MKLLQRFFGPPTPEQFAAAVRAEWRRRAGAEVQFDAERFLLVAPSGMQMNLSNFYAEHCSLSWMRRKGHVRRIVEAILTSQQKLPDDLETARPNLRPKIWARASFTLAELEARAQGETDRGPSFPLYPLGEHLYTSLVYDLPHSMASVGHQSLERWGLSYYEAMEIALENLERAPAQYAQLGEGLYASVTGDGFDSTRMLLLDRVRSLAVKGDPVVVVPHRDAMFMTGSEDAENLERLHALVQDGVDHVRQLSPLPLRLIEDAWQDWMPHEGSPAQAAFARLEIDFLGNMYAWQKPLLDAIHEREGKDQFVVPFSGFRKQDNPDDAVSLTLWGDGLDSLLPRSNLVVFMQGEEMVASGPWSLVEQTVGPLMEPVEDLYPRRYRVRAFPDAGQLAAIGKCL